MIRTYIPAEFRAIAHNLNLIPANLFITKTFWAPKSEILDNVYSYWFDY